MKIFKARIVLAMAVLSLTLTPLLTTWSAFAQLPQLPSPQSFFNHVKGRVIAGADKINQWKSDAEAAARKTVNDFGCSSSAAQTFYNGLKNKRAQLVNTKNALEEADGQAREARDRCKQVLPNYLDPQCDAQYNGLIFRAQADAAGAAIAAIDKALNVLRNLQCVAGCNKPARLIYPVFGLESPAGLNFRRAELALGNVITSFIKQQGSAEVRVCTRWERGSFSANFDSGNGELSASVSAKLPKCSETKTYPICTEWDINMVLPKLKQLRLVPPEVQAPDISIDVPNKEVQIVSGVTEGNCSQPVTVCKRASISINIDTGANPLSVLPGADCLETAVIGCANPPFNLTPIFATVQVPDITQTRISWKAGAIRGGSIIVDLTRPEFGGACKSTTLPPVPPPPKLNFRRQDLTLPYVCAEVRRARLVTNP
jgi:hypothetical protein